MGLFQYTVISFGLKNAPAIFSRVVVVVFKEYIEKEKGEITTIDLCPFYVTTLTKSLPPLKRMQKNKEWKDVMIERARWMRNLIPHPTSTHTAYF